MEPGDPASGLTHGRFHRRPPGFLEGDRRVSRPRRANRPEMGARRRTPRAPPRPRKARQRVRRSARAECLVGEPSPDSDQLTPRTRRSRRSRRRRHSSSASRVWAPRPIGPRCRRTAEWWRTYRTADRTGRRRKSGFNKSAAPRFRLTTDLRGCKEVSFALRDTCLVFSADDDVGQHVYQMPTLGGQPKLCETRRTRCANLRPTANRLSYVSLETAGLLRIGARSIEPGVHKVTPALR